MVNRIDAEARRRLLAEAVWNVILRGGLGAASVRGVAAEAGLATGSVRHFFPSQAELHNFAMRELMTEVTSRIEAAAASVDPEEQALAVLLELLPVTDLTVREFSAYLEFMDRSRTEPALQAVAHESVAAVRECVLAVLRAEVAGGRVGAGVDLEREALRLHALVDGLMWQMLVADLHSAETARVLVGDWLEDLRRSS